MQGYPTITNPGVPISPLGCGKYPHPNQSQQSPGKKQKLCCETVIELGDPLTSLGCLWGVHTRAFRASGGSWGLPTPAVVVVTFRTSPTGQQPPKTKICCGEERACRLQGFPLVLGLEMALGCPWSGDVGEGWAWGPWLPFTPVFSITLHPCHLSAGSFCLLGFLLLNYPSWKLAWSGHMHNLYITAGLQYVLKLSKSWTNRKAENTFQEMS